MRIRSLLPALLLLSSGSLGAQAVVGEIRFVPPAFYVGDKVEMTVELELEQPLELSEPGQMPESDWIEVLDIRTEADGRKAVIRIDFIPFAPGTRTLPAVDLGGLYIKDLKVPTRSVLTEDIQGVRTLRGQRLLPGTRLAVALILALAAMAPFIGFSGVRWAWKQIRRMQEAWRVGRPARRLRRTMRTLGLSIGDISSVSWYSALTEALRKYMTSKLGRDCMSATTAEIALMREFSQPEGPHARILDILQEGDMVKFAGQFADDRSLERTLKTTDKAIHDWERGHDQLH